jgi:Domain of unknown function (DUF1707)
MSTNRWMRASDQDREQAAGVLRDAYAVGRLSREELDERSTTAYSARTWGELQDLTGDLPIPAADSAPADLVARRNEVRLAWAPMIWLFLLVLPGSLAGREVARAMWVVAIVSMVLFFVFGTRGTRTGRARQRLR